MSRIFISYKRGDKGKVFKIKGQIESTLGEKCWIDLDGIESDAIFTNKIIGAINVKYSYFCIPECMDQLTITRKLELFLNCTLSSQRLPTNSI